MTKKKKTIMAFATVLCLIPESPCWLYKNDLVKYFMQYVQNGLIIHLTNGLKNNFCQN